MKKLIIFGNSILSEIASFYFTKFSNYEISYYAADKEFITSKLFLGKKILSVPELLKIDRKQYDLFIAIGYRNLNTVREKYYNFFKSNKFNFASFIHPNSKVYSSKLGSNNFIMENVSLNPYSEIGNNNIFWSSSIIGHHSKIGSHNFFSGNSTISGNCEIKSRCFWGVNSCCKDSVKINNYCFIDANQYVNSSLQKYTFYNLDINNKKIIKTNQIFNV